MTDKGLTTSVLKCKMSGYSFSFENVNGQQKTTVYYNVTDGSVKPPVNINSNTIQILPSGDCTATGQQSIYSDNTTFQSVNGVNLQFTLGVLADLGGWAGRSMVRFDTNTSAILDCCTFTQAVAQNNINDAYDGPTTPAPVNDSLHLIFSIILLAFVFLF